LVEVVELAADLFGVGVVEVVEDGARGCVAALRLPPRPRPLA
jgi:hypothetical protein